MKKWLVLVLCFILLCVAAVPVFAEEQPKVTIAASKDVVARGDEVTFTISMSGDVPFTTAAIDLSSAFDPAVFKYKSGNVQSPSTEGYSEAMPEIMMLWSSTGNTYNGVIQTITFEIKADAPIKSVTVSGSGTAALPNGGGNISITVAGTQIHVNCIHEYPDGWKPLDDTYCQRVCSKCSTPEQAKHDWESVNVAPEPTCTGKGTENFKCNTCSHTKTADVDPTGHKWSDDCDTTCNNGCGETRTTSHSYSSTWSTDGTNHWYQCSVCGDKKDVAQHTPGPEATETAAQTCTVCGCVITPILPHEHEWNTEWMQDSEYHWYRCTKTGCYETNQKAAHDYDNACDVDCNTCGYIRVAPHNYKPEWQANFKGHWQICGTCNTKSEVYPHVPGPEATMDTPQLCTECSFRIKMPLSHVHSYSGAWYSDEESHWQSCSDCGEPAQIAAHVWDAGEKQTDGKIKYTCTICTKQLTTDTPVGTEPDTAPTTQPTVPVTQPAQQDDSGRFPWEWAGIAAIVLLVIGIALLVVEFIRSRKTNMHGQFSK